MPAQWPKADFVIGNPPFLGTKLLRGGLGDDYVESLFSAYDDRIPGFSDLCCYWFELARSQLENHPTMRAGLLATQGIRGGENRRTLERITSTGSIFAAWSDREWILEGAAVHVSIVAFDNGAEPTKLLDGIAVPAINANLSTGVDVTAARRLSENAGVGFVADVKAGAFDTESAEARKMMAEPNAHGRPNSEVILPWFNGQDTTRRSRSMWIIDFGEMKMEEACKYEVPFAYVQRHVKPERDKVKRHKYRRLWWIHAEPCTRMREAIAPLPRYLVTPTLTKHRLFTWVTSHSLPDHQLIAFGRSDDYFFRVLHSSVHELWTRKTGTQLREAESGFRYTPSSTFETFPFPSPPGEENPKHPTYMQIAEAAKSLNKQRERWLNPPEWIEPLAAKVDAADTFEDVPKEARPLVRQSAIMAAAAKDARLKKRTLTNLYNERPTWLKLAHEKLDRAVLAAYAATDPGGEWSEDWATVWIDTGAGQRLPADHALYSSRAEIDQKVLAALLRLNALRAAVAQ